MEGRASADKQPVPYLCEFISLHIHFDLLLISTKYSQIQFMTMMFMKEYGYHSNC
jgi:hypothetical protein